MIKIYNEDCFETLNKLEKNSVDIVLTSPPYNTSRVSKSGDVEAKLRQDNGHFPDDRYDVHNDNMTNEEYCDFTKRLFLGFDKILKENGVVLYNISYGSENSECMFRAINSILVDTPFTIADVIVWKKATAIPNNVSKNKLTRICEFVFVFCRETEFMTFTANKMVVSSSSTGQDIYENIYNYVEARNNDECCPYNKSTYSVELCTKLLGIYAPKNATVYDPFMGSGTTAVACKKLRMNCYGSEISENQYKWANDRLSGVVLKNGLW